MDSMAEHTGARAGPEAGSAPISARRNRSGEARSGRCRLAELLILCARIGFNP